MMNTKLFALLAVFMTTTVVFGDVYMHNPRGSNNRNCRNDNNDRRRNGDRLFDSQNNDKGGYSCPRAYPFPAGQNDRTAVVNEYGDIVSSDGTHVDTDTFFYYEGSELTVEWTNQHGCGTNGNLDCRVVLQYACNTDLPDSADDYLRSLITNEYLRDGTPVNNNDGDNTNDEATTTIPADINSANCNGNGNINPPNCAMDGRYGFHETHAWYQWCEQRERNKGLFTADQLPLPTSNNRNRAKNTRQNPDGNRRGLECPEERDYYPYWTPTMWKDIAVGVPATSLDACKEYVKESQNVVDKCYCDMSGVTGATTPYPNNEAACTVSQGAWKCAGKWDLPEPQCFALPWMRDNHLGNTVNGYALQFNWTMPSPPSGSDTMRCVLRMRYNTTTGDFPQDLDYLANCSPNDNACTNSPIYDRDNREEKTYVHYFDMSETPDERNKLSLAVNTNQYARTFQDRSYVFDIRSKPGSVKDMCKKKIYNLNVRGKRGNIVQVYPSVEYDFTPQDLSVEEKDCLHIQWIGSDYNPNRNPNNGEGGPYNPNNQNEAKADRSNLLQFEELADNHGLHIANVSRPFFTDADGNPDYDMMTKFAFIDQNVADCDDFTTLKARNPNDRQARERDPRNCAKLNSAKTPYFKGAVVRANNRGSHQFMSTRNNNFSNRSQKLKIDVGDCTTNCGGSSLSDGQIAGIVIGVTAAVGAAAFLIYTFALGKAWNIKSKMNMQRSAKGPSKPAV